MRLAWNRTSDDIRESVILEYDNGFIDIPELGKRHGISDVTCRKIIRAAGYPPLKSRGKLRSLSKVEEEEIAKQYCDGTSIKVLVRRFKISPERVKSILEIQQIQIRSWRDSIRIYDFDSRRFQVIDTAQKAYWLGFLAADGCVFVDENKPTYRLALSLQASDIEHIEKFAAFMKAEHPIKCRSHQDGRQFAALTLHSKDLIEDVAQYGIIPRKTFAMTWPALPSHLYRHYVRGYFDGDGHCCWKFRRDGHKKINFGFTCADQAYLECLQAFLMQECSLPLNRIHRRQSSRALCLSWGGRLQLERFSELIYRYASIYLERKRNKIKDAISQKLEV